MAARIKEAMTAINTIPLQSAPKAERVVPSSAGADVPPRLAGQKFLCIP